MTAASRRPPGHITLLVAIALVVAACGATVPSLEDSEPTPTHPPVTAAPSTGKFELGKATTAAEVGKGYVALNSAAIGETVTGAMRPCVIDVYMKNVPTPTAGHWNIMDIYSPGKKVHHVSTDGAA